jgi:hypothetical protein
MPEIPESALVWAAEPGAAKFLSALRNRMKRTGRAQGMLSFRNDPLTFEERLHLSKLFGTQSKMIAVDRVNLRMMNEQLNEWGVSLEDLDLAVSGPLVTNAAAQVAQDLSKKAEVARRRAALDALMQPFPELDLERELLLDQPLTATHRVPPESRTGTNYWSPYDAAIRCAVAYLKWRQRETDPIPERTLLSEAFGNSKSKRMKDAGRPAFERLMRNSYDELVKRAQTGIRLSGPFRWMVDHETAANANLAAPWITVPSKEILDLDEVKDQVRGVLLVENQETFEQICIRTGVRRRWLCIWNEGYASKDLVEFVRQYRGLPIAACCDHDPRGIDIVDDLVRRLGFAVSPVGMDVATWKRSKKMDEPEEDREMWAAEAQKLRDTCHPALRPLAVAIAETGERVEQEAMELYWELIETIPAQLESLRGLPAV